MTDFQPLTYSEIREIFPAIAAPSARIEFLSQFDDYVLEAMTRDGHYVWGESETPEILVATLEELEALYKWNSAKDAQWLEVEAFETARELSHMCDTAALPVAKFDANNMTCNCGQRHSLMTGQALVKCSCGATFQRPELGYRVTTTALGETK